VELTYLGTNTLLIKKGSSTLLIDPHFSRPSLIKLFRKIKPNKKRIVSGLKDSGIEVLDGVLLTHTHYDHAMDAAAVVKQVGGVLYGSKSAVNLAKDADLSQEDYQLVLPHNRINIGEFDVAWLDSQHISFPPPFGWLMPKFGRISQPLSPPIHFWGYQCGEVYAILVDNLLIFGSAGYMQGAYRDSEARVVVMSIGGLETKPGRYLEKLYRDLVVGTGAQRVLISHWDNFFKPFSANIQALGFARSTILRLKKLGKRYGQSVKVLHPCETIKI